MMDDNKTDSEPDLTMPPELAYDTDTVKKELFFCYLTSSVRIEESSGSQ